MSHIITAVSTDGDSVRLTLRADDPQAAHELAERFSTRQNGPVELRVEDANTTTVQTSVLAGLVQLANRALKNELPDRGDLLAWLGIEIAESEARAALDS